MTTEPKFIYPKDLCICGHIFDSHCLGFWNCETCYQENLFDAHTFAMDNLTYIEQLATQKGLV